MQHKILIINNGLAGGGVERASVSLANYFAEQGHFVTILSLYQSEHFYTLHSAINHIEPDFTRKKLNKQVYVVRMVYYARKVIKQIKPDTILAFGEWTNPYMVLANMGLFFPLYLTDRMHPYLKLPFASKVLKALLYKFASGIIAQTSFSKEVLLKRTKSKNIKVINNPVNAIERVECEPKNRIVSVGRLSPEKGHRYLIEAFATIKANNWELSIVGDGPEMPRLRMLAEELLVADKVVFHGHLRDFGQQLSEAQIFVLPSFKEGFPNALLEAMSLPLACITTDYSQGHNEIINHGENGLIVQPGNVEEMAEAINLLINDTELRKKLAENAFKVRDDYSFEKIGNLWLNFVLNQQG